jgi:uncharacterized protein YkwD
MGAFVAALALALSALMFDANAAQGDDRVPKGFISQLVELINDYRTQQGLAPLAFTEDLELLATEHSASMASLGQLSHDGFRARFQRTASKICVENVGWNYATPQGLLAGWQRSPAHHRNLLEPKVVRMGVAADARYVTFFACR